MKISYLLDILGRSTENVCVNVFYDGGSDFVSVRGPAEQIKNAIADYQDNEVTLFRIDSVNNCFDICISSNGYTVYDSASNPLPALLDTCLPEQKIDIVTDGVTISGRAERIQNFFTQVTRRYDVTSILISKYSSITIQVEEHKDD